MAERTERILIQLQLDQNQLIQSIQKAKDAVELSNKQLERARMELKKLEAEGTTTGATYDNLTDKIIQYEKTLKIAKDQQRDYEKQLRLSQVAQQGQGTSLNAQKAQLSVLTAQYNALTEEERKNSSAGQQLAADIKAITDNLVKNETALGNSRRLVGSYGEAIKKAFDELGFSKEKVNDLKFQIDQLKSSFEQGNVEEAKFNQELSELTKELKVQTEQTEQLSGKLDKLKSVVENDDAAIKSLRTRLREAKDEATAAQDAFSKGLINESQLISAQQKVAGLTDELNDFQKRVAALDPDAKFKAFTQVAAGLAGGLAAVQGGMALFGEESEETQKALLKVQAAMTFAQGLNQLAELGDSLKNLRIILGLTTSAQKAQTVAQTETNVATNAGTGATVALAGAENVATASTARLSVAMKSLLIGSGLLLLPVLVFAVVEAFDAFSKSGENIEDIIDLTDGETRAHQRTIDIIKQRNTEATSATQNELNLAKARGASEQELADLREKLRKQNADGLVRELIENKQHLQELQAQKKDFEAKLAPGASTSTEDREKASDEIKKIDEELQETIQRNAQITNVELRRLDAERVTDFIETERKIIDEQNKISELRIANITDDHKREIEAAKLATKAAIDAVLDGEADAAEKKALIAQAGEQRIAEINRNFALRTLQEKNQLAIALTREGSEDRVNAEILAAQREREELLKNTRLTQLQRQLIIADSNNKILALEADRIRLLDAKVADELEVERRKQTAIQQIRAALAQTPAQSFDAERQNLEENFQFQLKALEKSNEDKFNEITNAANAELALNIQNSTAKERLTQEFADKQQRILDEANKKIIANDEATAAERNAILLKSGQDLVELTQKRFNAEAEIKILQLQRIESELNSELAAVQKGTQREIDLKRQLEAVKAEIAKAGIDSRLKFLEHELQVGKGLNEKEYAEYLLLLSKKKEADTEYSEAKRERDRADFETFRQEAIDSFNSIYQAALASSQRQTDARIKDINAELDAQLAALDEKQAKEEGTFVEKTALEKKYDAEREALRQKAADQEKRIKLKQWKADQQAAEVQAAIAGAVAFVEALPNYFLAAAVAISTAAEIAIISGQQPPEFKEGGFTEKGDPREVSIRHSNRQRTVHKSEYIIPDPVLKDPEVKQYVETVIEPKRLRNLGKSFSLPSISQRMNQLYPLSQSFSASILPQFAQGGYAPAPVIVSPGGAPPQIDTGALTDGIAGVVLEAVRNMPNPVVSVVEITDTQSTISKVEARANL